MKNIILKGLFFCSLLLTMQPLSAANTVEKVEKVSGVVTLNRAVDYVVTSATPFADGAVVNITDVDNAVLILAQVKPSKATALYSHIQINGVKASSANCMVKIYADGSIILPHASSISPLTVYTDNDCQGESESYAVGNRLSLSGKSMNNRICSFTLKRGYMAWFAQKADGTGFNRLWIADKGDIKINLPGALRKAISALRVSEWKDTSKKGYAGNDVTANTMLNTTWCYNWDAGVNVWADREYVTQHHHEGWPGIADVGNNGTSANILGNNEPDNVNDDREQVNSVADVLATWPQMMATGRRLGTPAMSSNLNWLYEFIDSIDARGWRCEFVAVHSYWYEDWGSWKSRLTNIHNRTRRPIWITEMNYGANWTGWPGSDTDYGANNEAILAQHLNPVIDGLEETPWLERYAVYNWVQNCRKVYDNDHGRLTKAGQYYADKPSAIAYNSTYDVMPQVKKIMKDPTELFVDYDKAAGKAVLTWKEFNGEYNYAVYVERKVDGGSWEKLTEIDPQEGVTTYTFTDEKAVSGANYRIHLIDAKEKDRYSRAVAAVSLDHEVGDAITYKGTTKYLGGNVFPNGDFDLGSTGWTNGLGQPISEPEFTIVPVGGIDDGAYLQVRTNDGMNKSGALKTIVEVTPHSDYYYFISSRNKSTGLHYLYMTVDGNKDSTAAAVLPTEAWSSSVFEVNTGSYAKAVLWCYYMNSSSQIDKVTLCKVFDTPEEAYRDGVEKLLQRAQMTKAYLGEDSRWSKEIDTAIAAATTNDVAAYTALNSTLNNVMEAAKIVKEVQPLLHQLDMLLTMSSAANDEIKSLKEQYESAVTSADVIAAYRLINEVLETNMMVKNTDEKIVAPHFDIPNQSWKTKCGTYQAGTQRMSTVAGKSCWQAQWSDVSAAEGKDKTMEVKQTITAMPHGLYALECKAATELMCLSDQHGYLTTPADTVETPLLTADYLDLPSVDNETKWQTLVTPYVYLNEGDEVTIGFVGSKANAVDNAWHEFGVNNSQGDKREGWWCATDFTFRHFPVYRRTISDGEWSTLCLPYRVTPPTNVKLYQLAGITSDYKKLCLEEVNSVEAGEPCIYHMTGTEAWMIEEGEAVTNAQVTPNQLRGNFKTNLSIRNGYYFMENGEWKRATSSNRPKLTNFGACLISVLKLPVYEGWAGVTMNITGADEEVADGIDHAELLPEQETISYSLDGREAPATHQGVKVVKVKGSKEVKKILR